MLWLSLLCALVGFVNASNLRLDKHHRLAKHEALLKNIREMHAQRNVIGGDDADMQPHLTGVPTVSFCNTTLTPLVTYSYSWSPQDIEANEDVHFTLNSYLYETVTSGTVYVTVKLNGFKVLSDNYDLCTYVVDAGLSCPLSSGPYDIDQTVSIGDIPVHGTFDIKAEVVDQNNQQLTCVEVTVKL